MKLSPHFALSEFTASQTADRLNLDNTPSMQQVKNMEALCDNLLEPLRQNFGAPVNISSGFRSPALNLRIGGSVMSQHCLGEAADFTVQWRSNHEVARWIERNLSFDQLILEYWRAKDPRAGWIHASWTQSRGNRRTVLNVDARTPGKYLPGIPSLSVA